MSELEDRINSILSDPKQMEQVMDMARSLMGGEDTPPQKDGLSALLQGFSGGEAPDLGLPGRLAGLMSGSDNDRRALLEALKPWLSARRREKLERAMRMARLARVASAVLGETGGGHV